VEREVTLGSLFDGIGGFPLAASRAGIRPVWASEIQKAPVSITKKHFPEMEHLGDIRKINGANIKPVDIITFGSPCQDLSVSGRRAGLRGKRSSLFLQAVRIIKEMRVATNNTYPTRIVWENVPGAFSTNSGNDFKTVIEQIATIAEPGISVPRPPGGRWLAAGAVLGDGYSVAWRCLDAQYWGLPQKRRRIFLVADFTGKCAGEILFDPEGGPRDNKEVGEAGESDTHAAESGVTQHGITYCIIGNTIDRTYKSGGNGLGVIEDVSYTLTSTDRHAVTVPYISVSYGEFRRGEIGRTLLANEDSTSGDLILTAQSVRRLTPLEYERLQGYPDYWTLYGHNGKIISDSQRYKALGNSIAVPCVQFILDGMKREAPGGYHQP
jgi:DNA (cytosine-5)-methyltransferase 1